jgi:protein-tyrosine kinase
MSLIEDALKKAKEERSEGTGKNAEAVVEAVPEASPTAFQEVDAAWMEEKRIVTLTGQPSPITEQYRMLRTQILQKTEGDGHNCLMVTSAIDGEGKTTTAINLAVAIAKEVHKSVLLVDADLRRPSVHRTLGLRPEKGLIQYLTEDVPLGNLLIRTGLEKLTFLPAGGCLADSTEVLGSSKMRNLIQEVKERYKNRYVIFDTTPLLQTADPTVLSQFMDGVIVVVQAERTPRGHLAEALTSLKGRNILGIVLNNVSEISWTYNYYKL